MSATSDNNNPPTPALQHFSISFFRLTTHCHHAPACKQNKILIEGGGGGGKKKERCWCNSQTWNWMQLPEKHLHTSRSSLIFNSPSQTHVSQILHHFLLFSSRGPPRQSIDQRVVAQWKNTTVQILLENRRSNKTADKIEAKQARKANAIAGFIVFKQTSSSPGSDTGVRCPKH